MFLTALVNGLAYGLLLFLLASGLTVTFGLLGVLNFAHASFYMLGAYFAYSLAGVCGFWIALVAAPLGVGLAGAVVYRGVLVRLAAAGHTAEMLATFGVAALLGEAVQLVWGRAPLSWQLPAALQSPIFSIGDVILPASRLLMMGVSIGILAVLWLAVARNRLGLVLRAAMERPEMVEALGYDLPRLRLLVFAAGSALAGLAGVLGGAIGSTEPGMATALGSILFVVVVAGRLGSLTGAFVASLAVGLLQSFAVASDLSIATVGQWLASPLGFNAPLLASAAARDLTLARVAPLLPFLLLVAVLLIRRERVEATAFR
ncbi:MAG: branched-chain amino acid ABC transporter permease [Janthinobacterium lividum]